MDIIWNGRLLISFGEREIEIVENDSNDCSKLIKI